MVRIRGSERLNGNKLHCVFSHSYLITDMLFLPHRYLSCLHCGTVFLLLLSPSSAFGLHLLQEGASLCPLSLCPHHPFLFHICSGSTSVLAGLGSVSGGKVWKEREFKKKKEGGGDDDGGWSLKKAISSKDTPKKF